MLNVARYRTVRDEREHLTTIMTAFQPIERYRSADPSAQPSTISPLDFYVAHLLMEFLTGSATVLHLTADNAQGESAVMTVQHAEVRQTILVGASPTLRERISAFFNRSESNLLRQAEKFRCLDSLNDLAGDNCFTLQFVWIHFHPADAHNFRPMLTQVLSELPHSIILCTGLGAVGQCPGIATLIQCGQEGTHRFRLARELVEVFSHSTLGIVSQVNDAPLEQALFRIQQLHNGNFDYLRLLRVVHAQAMETAKAQNAPTDDHRTFLELNAKTVKRSRAALEMEIETLRTQLAVAPPFQVVADPIVNTLAYRVAIRLQRLRHRLAPPTSVRFKIYRTGIKVARATLWRPLHWLRRKTKLVLGGR